VLKNTLLGLSEDDILIGGQSILFWCNNFNISSNYPGALTDDVDILGTQNSVYKIASKTKGRADITYSKQFSSLIGTITVLANGEHFVNIDILSEVLGIKNEEVIKFAVPVTLDDAEFLVQRSQTLI